MATTASPFRVMIMQHWEIAGISLDGAAMVRGMPIQGSGISAAAEMGGRA